jgi:hypothetical protein
MNLIYTKEKTRENAYKVTTIIDGVEHIFNCVVANDTEADLDELVQWNIDNVSAPFVEPQLSYVDKRKNKYPEIGNQLDMLWHELNNSGSLSTGGMWFNTIQQVKENNPKP